MFASGLVFQGLLSIPSNSNPPAASLLAWSFFVINLAIIIGLVAFFGLPNRSKDEETKAFEVNAFRVALYLMLASVIAGFALLYNVVLLLGHESAAIAGWVSFGFILVVWALSIVVRSLEGCKVVLLGSNQGRFDI